jgi:hypothetical protein
MEIDKSWVVVGNPLRNSEVGFERTWFWWFSRELPVHDAGKERQKGVDQPTM